MKMKKLLLTLFIGILSAVVFGQTKTEMKPADLPKPITDYVAKNVKSFTIDKAFKVDSKGVITYDLLLKNGNDKVVFIFDKDGKFVERAARGEKAGAKPQPATPTTTQPKK